MQPGKYVPNRDPSDTEVYRTVYRIVVGGRLDARWSAWFDGMTIAVERGNDGQPVTTLTGPVIDQAALYGILWKLRDLNLKLISVAPAKRDLTGPDTQRERRNAYGSLDSDTRG